MKKYQGYIVHKQTREHPKECEFRKFYVQVEQRDGNWVACGKPIDITHLSHHFDMGMTAYAIDKYGEEEGMIDAIPPEGFTVIARYWLPDNYVPESLEVVREREERATQHLRERGIID